MTEDRRDGELQGDASAPASTSRASVLGPGRVGPSSLCQRPVMSLSECLVLQASDYGRFGRGALCPVSLRLG